MNKTGRTSTDLDASDVLLTKTNIALIVILSIGVFALHYPGQASIDTILQLQDGISKVYDSNQPPAMSYFMARLTLPGMLTLNIFLFSLVLLQLLRRTPLRPILSKVVVIFLFLYPVLVIHIGIVWKDVLFAHAALLGLLLLPRAGNLRWSELLLSALVMALCTSVRQQGILVAAIAMLYILAGAGLVATRRRRWEALAIWIVMYSLTVVSIKVAVEESGDTSENKAIIGPMYQLALFDLAGISVVHPDIRFPALEASAPEIIEAHQPTRERILKVFQKYHPDRQDWMWQADTETSVWFPHDALFSDWRTRIHEYPGAYLAHRLQVSSWIFGCHQIDKCFGLAVGISDQPSEMVAETGIKPGVSTRAKFIEDIGQKTIFLFRPLFYISLSTGLFLLLLYIDHRRHALMIAIQMASLAYAGSYFLIGIACDFRYTYFSTVAALIGIGYIFLTGIHSNQCQRPELGKQRPNIKSA